MTMLAQLSTPEQEVVKINPSQLCNVKVVVIKDNNCPLLPG